MKIVYNYTRRKPLFVQCMYVCILDQYVLTDTVWVLCFIFFTQNL